MRCKALKPTSDSRLQDFLGTLQSFEAYTPNLGPVAGSVGIEGGVVSGVINLESLGVRAPSRRPRHENRYHDA